MTEEKTEVDQLIETLQKESGLVDVFRRLSGSPDFQAYEKEFLDKGIAMLQAQLSELDFEKETSLAIAIQNQLRAFRNIKNAFNDRKNRDVSERLNELEKSRRK